MDHPSEYPKIRVPLTVPHNQYWHEDHGYIIRMDPDDTFAAWEDRDDQNCVKVVMIELGAHEFVYGPIPMKDK